MVSGTFVPRPGYACTPGTRLSSERKACSSWTSCGKRSAAVWSRRNAATVTWTVARSRIDSGSGRDTAVTFRCGTPTSTARPSMLFPLPAPLTQQGGFAPVEPEQSHLAALRESGLRRLLAHPAHQAAQLLPDLLDRVLLALLLQLGEVRAARVVLGHPLAGERAVLDLAQDLLHLLLHRGRDHARPA